MSRTQLGRQEDQVVKVSIRCEDCGNQAKKDCAYSRCRTCCKNKGFHCQTHITSTWIPVDRRRHRMDSTNNQHQQHHHLQVNQGDIPQRHNKQIPFTSLEDRLKFPGVMSSMAAFSCVRVRSMDDTVNEIAYQTSVKIGGHVFSGLLYDQGPDQQQSPNSNAINAIVDPQDHHHQHNNLNLFGSAAIHTTRNAAGATAATASTMAPVLSATTSTAPHHHHQLFYPPPHPLANSFRPGMPYFPQYPKP